MRHMCPKGVSSVSNETHVSHAVPNLKLLPPPTAEEAGCCIIAWCSSRGKRIDCWPMYGRGMSTVVVA